ncbi:MAG: phosphate acyltransferase PlsX [Coriobacteriia bacterium]|nr:phosphate acyltransferase PlsX [Coriobacteriia bacterium]
MKIVVDAMGGDNAPAAVIDGVRLALDMDDRLEVVLTGDAEAIVPITHEYSGRATAVVTTETISMSDHPANAVRAKKDSSIVVGCRLVADGEADGLFSAGSTGATMTAATLVIGRIKGIARPMVATLLPTAKDTYVVLGDSGANADVKAEYLLQFGQMGEAYAKTAWGLEKPRVALLNIGEEPSKGSELAQAAYQLMSKELPGFVGNVEGTEILSGEFDVIVTDGFSGNIVLKTIEGTVALLFQSFYQVLNENLENESEKAGVVAGLAGLLKKLSADEVGGAPLLGVSASCFIGHGSSSPKAIANGVLATHKAALNGLTEVIAKAVAI